MITENLSTLKIHNLTKEQYERELAAGRIDENALYLTPYEETDLSEYATQEYVDEALAGKQPVGDYALKSEIPTDYLTEIPSEYVTETELNSKGYLTSYTETDPTVPAWAKAATKPTYTASEVGALPADTVIPTVPTNVSAFTNDAGYLTQHQSLAGYATETYANTAVSNHNTNNSAHNDIRLLIEGLTNRLNTLADSDDTTLDQMSEIVAYIKSNKSLIDSITTSKVNVADIINNLTTNVSNKPLSAAQGVALKALIDALQTEVDGKADEGHTHNYAGSSSVGGSANSAVKLDTSAGSATQPVYFSNGKPVATIYTLGASVPSDAKFTDTTYDVATTSVAGLMSAADKAKLDGLSESGGGSGGSAEGAVLYTSQALTDAQKQQARTNIGAQQALTFDTEPASGSTNPVTSGGLFSKFAAQDESIEMVGMIANMAMPGSLKWDGYVGDRECVIAYEEPVAEGVTVRMQYVHVSDYVPETLFLMMGEVPAEERIILALCSMSAMEVGGMHETVEMQAQVADDMFIMSEAFVYIPTDGYSIEGIAFPKKGWYLMSQSYYMDDIEMPIMYVSGLKLEMLNFPDNNGGDADKYFENVEEKTYFGDTLTWDGNIDGRVCIEHQFGSGDIVINAKYVKMSDSVLSVTDFVNGFTSLYNNGTQQQKSYEDIINSDMTNSDGFISINSIACVPTDNYNILGVTFPEAGIYFGTDGTSYPTSFTVPGYNFVETEPRSVIKTEHLPKALQFGEITKTEETGGDTLTWDGKSGTIAEEESVNNITIRAYIVSNAAPIMSDLKNGFSIIINNNGKVEENIITADMVNDYTVVYEDGNIAIHFPDDIVPRIMIEHNPLMATCFVKSEFTGGEYTYPISLTINGYTGFPVTTTEIVKIDEKYLPDGFGGEGGDSLPEVSTEDNGKFLRVVNGAPAWASIPNAEEATF